MITINVDKPTKTVTIHKSDCDSLNKTKKEQDGYHQNFKNIEDAQKYIKEKYPEYKLNMCSKCFK